MTDQPAFGDIIKANGPGLDGTPDSRAPFFGVYREGIALKRRTLIGRGAVIMDKMPESYPELGHHTGVFDFEADPIPANLMAQVTDFFERVYDYQDTEAMVLLTMHNETKEWRIFVPTQMVSGGGVNYVIDPSHIRYPWILVGSIHSHCNFGAHESSVDTGDGADFDGFHGVIGQIKSDPPDITAMVAMQGVFFKYYDKKEHHKYFDFSKPKDPEHTAPDWWFRYVEDTKEKIKPVGYELFELFGKNPAIKNERHHQRTANETYYKAPTYAQPKRQYSYTKTTYHRKYNLGEMGDMELERWLDTLTVKELEEFGLAYDFRTNAWRPKEDFTSLSDDEVLWGNEGELLWWGKGSRKLDHWEDLLPEPLLKVIYSSDVVDEDSLDTAVDHPEKGGDPLWWRALALSKIRQWSEIIEATGAHITFGIQLNNPPALPPGDTTESTDAIH